MEILPQPLSVVGAGLLYVNKICSKQKNEDVLRLFLKREAMHLDAS